MGQRNSPRSIIPSLVEYRTIQLLDRYATPPDSRTDLPPSRPVGGLSRTGPECEERPRFVQGQLPAAATGSETHLNGDADGQGVTVSSPQLPPSLASCGGLHSFSQMAPFLPNISAQRGRRHPTLQPLSLPGLASGQSGEASETTGFESTLSPFLRNIVPEAFLSARNTVISTLSSVPVAHNNKTDFFHSQTLGATSVAGLESAGTTGTDNRKIGLSHASEPKLWTDKLPPIARTHCTVHSSTCTCVHAKGPREQAETKKNPSTRRKEYTTALKKIKRDDRKGSDARKNEGKNNVTGTKQQKVKRTVAVKTKASSSSEQRMNSSPSRRRKAKTPEGCGEEEGLNKSYKASKERFHFSPGNIASRNTGKPRRDNFDIDNEEENDELLYYHRLTSILHPLPVTLPPIKGKGSLGRSPVAVGIIDRLGEKSEDSDNLSWARDGFLDDSALQRAIQLRNRALYSNNNVSSNNTASEDSAGENAEDENGEEREEVGENQKVEETEIEEQIEQLPDASAAVPEVPEEELECSPRSKTAKAQAIRSMTWQEVSSHLGPKRERERERKGKRVSRAGHKSHLGQKSTSVLAAEVLRHLQQQQKQHTKSRDHSYGKSTLPGRHPSEQCSGQGLVQNLPPVRLFRPQELSVNCYPWPANSTGHLPGARNDKRDASAHQQQPPQETALLFPSSYPRFIKMLSVPLYKNRPPPSDQSGKEKHFGGVIDGMKVKPKDFRDTGSPGDVPKDRATKGQAKRR